MRARRVWPRSQAVLVLEVGERNRKMADACSRHHDTHTDTQTHTHTQPLKARAQTHTGKGRKKRLSPTRIVRAAFQILHSPPPRNPAPRVSFETVISREEFHFWDAFEPSRPRVTTSQVQNKGWVRCCPWRRALRNTCTCPCTNLKSRT